MENRKQLISKLKSLNPTDGEWRYKKAMYFEYIEIGDIFSCDTDGLPEDDQILITLAPSMREELIKMEKMYTEEDVRKAIELARDGYSSMYNPDEIINQLNHDEVD